MTPIFQTAPIPKWMTAQTPCCAGCAWWISAGGYVGQCRRRRRKSRYPSKARDSMCERFEAR